MSDKLEVVDFGRRLVETGDLDPVYVMLWNAQLGPKKLQLWLLAYWCYYHCGTASWIVDQPNYWAAMTTAADSSDYPRGTERRHFRGRLSANSVRWLRGEGIGLLFGEFDRAAYENKRLPLDEVMEYVQCWVGFGPWIAFKVADMLERLGICRIAFTDADTFLFNSPKEGAALVVSRYANGATVSAKEAPAWAFKYLHEHLGHLDAPPRYERRLNGQEYETILCKWKSHLSGHYSVGKDIHEIREGLLRFARWPTAQLLLKGLTANARS